MSQPEEPAPASPATELEPDNQQPPIQSDSIPAPETQPPPMEIQSEPIYEIIEDQIYDEPTPDLPSAGAQTKDQTPRVQTVLNQTSPVNVVVPYPIQPSGGYPVQNNFQTVTSQPASPAPTPLPAGPQPQNQTFPGYTRVQRNYPVGGVPGGATLPAGLQSNNQPPVQLVLIQDGASNPATQRVQPYPAPAAPPVILTYGIPPGLEYLTQVDQVLVRQKIQCIKILTCYQPSNHYEIKNSIGQDVYRVKEESDCFARSVLGPIHNFKLRIENSTGQEVIRMEKPMQCFLQEIAIQAPPGITIGYVKQEWSFLNPKFSVIGPNNEVQLAIHGPFLPFDCCSEVIFEVKSLLDGQTIGRIIKEQSNFISTFFADDSNFRIEFPLDLDVKIKAVLLGACFLIDIIFYNKNGTLLFKLLRGLI
ncbi:phospholipid scramblase 2 isoform X3 [Danio aesculapii]|uniref:phospholipid scramblase 2 isoform X3 n=1 Tax=Danio aesculapii TaxID=1142201 RepID=UPI0024C0240A|nr:phospholipid scramblase 2 isoform X3 [Danio aesculapii]